MKTDEQYVAEFVELFEKHLTWNNQRVMDMFKAEHGSMNEDESSASSTNGFVKVKARFAEILLIVQMKRETLFFLTALFFAPISTST